MKTEELTAEIAALDARHAELRTEAEQTGQALRQAQEALITGKGTAAKVTASYIADAALKDAIVAIGQRIEAKRQELSAAEDEAEQAAQIGELFNLGREFEAARAGIDAASVEIVAAIATLPGLVDLIAQAESLQLSFAHKAEQLKVSGTLEGEGQSIRVSSILGANLHAQVLKHVQDVFSQETLATALRAFSVRRSWEVANQSHQRQNRQRQEIQQERQAERQQKRPLK
jgi:hypothetical protein